MNTRWPGMLTPGEILLRGLGIGVGERYCQSCARDRKKNDDCAIRKVHDGVGQRHALLGERRTCLRAFRFDLWLYTGRVARTEPRIITRMDVTWLYSYKTKRLLVHDMV